MTFRMTHAPNTPCTHSKIYYFKLYKEFCEKKIGIPVVLKGDFLWYSFRCTSAFSVPSSIIYLVGTKMLNTINLTYGLSNGFLAQWIMRCPYTLKVSGSTPVWWDFFLFCVVVWFCFFFKNIGSVLQHQFIRK